MCRFLIYKGKEPIKLSHLLTRPEHSIIKQSFDSRLRLDRRRPMNGDGFGVAYYTEDPEINLDGPCLFKAITPAWNNQNLETLAEKTKSRLVFAHVRASTYGTLSETNCHPFTYHRLTFMHNGGIGNFHRIKRKLFNRIDDKYLLIIQGSTDSECAFALFLDVLDKMGYDPAEAGGCLDSTAAAEVTSPSTTNTAAGKTQREREHHRARSNHVLLRRALVQTIDLLRQWTKEAAAEEAEARNAKAKGTPAASHVRVEDAFEPSLLNFAVTDGECIVVSRYITSSTDEAPSLHFSCGSSFVESAPGEYRMERLDRNQDVVMVASEPLTFERGDWTAVPTNSILTVRNQTVLLHPLIDEYYQTDPLYARSATLAESKGLMGSVPVSSPVDPKVPPLERDRRVYLT